MLAPARVWWKPLHRYEKSWLIVAFAFCIFLTAMMPLWYLMGRQNVPVTTYSVEPEQFAQITEAFAAKYKIGEINGVPVVAPPPNSDVYIIGRRWVWYPVVQLQKGQTYRLHISSLDLQHGFSLQPNNLNLQVMPGYDYVATIVPTQAGEYSVICNEFCAIGHHLMTGRIIVTE
ncbi:MAG: cytochrome C oxidase subunit II [Chloroflexi bacterium]|nr:cytochrome C oxidase subunit II [Chloroflexota bacterium]